MNSPVIAGIVAPAGNPAATYLINLGSEKSRITMYGVLRQVAALLTGADPQDINIFDLDWSQLRYEHTSALRARLIENYAPATVNKYLAAVRGVLKETWRLGLMNAEDYHRAVDLGTISGESLPAGRDLDDGEVRALVKVCQQDPLPAGVRDAAIIGLLYTGGLRRAEAAALTLADVDTTTGQLIVRSGKGRKARTVYLQGGALDALLDWLEVRGPHPGALLLPINKGGRIQERPLTAQAIYRLLNKRAVQAGVKAFSPHDFRRTFVGDLLDRGVDIVTVQRLAGHADPKTTARYDRRPETAKRQAAARLHFPYQRRRKPER